MKIEPNMYVRTENRGIAKFRGWNAYDENKVSIHTRNEGDIEITPIIDKNTIIKVSHNIIDLIEVGDYVNGSKVIDISIIGKDKEKWVWVEQMEDTDNKYGDDYVGYNNEQIKSIVTSQQFESMSYKVGEE